MNKTLSSAAVAVLLFTCGSAYALDAGPKCESSKLGTSAKSGEDDRE
jgi:hypothetical protein